MSGGSGAVARLSCITFLVMADPEGNEFCLLPGGEWRIDDDGVAHYPRETAT